ncbi:STAS domain-containing protein [Spirillospora sp. CA-255316]
MMTDDGRTTGRTSGRQRHARRAPDLRCRSGGPRPVRDSAFPACPPLLEVEAVETRGDTALAEVRGEIDLQTADLLRTRLTALHAAGHRHLVVDFAAVPFCDAAGLGALVAVHNRVAAEGGEVRLARVRPAQRKLLRITGLHRVFSLYEDVEDALAGHSAPTATPSS